MARSLFVLLSLPFLIGCAREPFSSRQENINGVFHEMVIVGKAKPERERILSEAFQMFREINGKINSSEPTSETSRINQKGFEKPQPVSPETFDLIQRSVEFFKKSGGAFDITALPLKKLWGFYGSEPHLPRPEEIQNLLPLVGSNQLILDRKKSRVGFRLPQMEMDLAAIAKGYACDRVMEFFKTQGIEHALVNVGGTIRASGKSPDRRPWRVGLRHPRDPMRTFKVVTLTNEAISTTADDEQFFVLASRRYSHVLNPRTGYPANQSVTVSVIAPSALVADALSHSLFVLGPEKAPSLANQFPQARWYLTYLTDGDRFKTLSSESVS